MFRRSAVLFSIAAALFALAAQGCSSDGIVSPVAAETSYAREASSVTIDIQVSPATLILKDEGEWVTIHAAIPYSTVDAGSVTLDGVEPALTFADDCGDLVAKFDHAVICAMVAPPEATLTLTGVTTAGEFFEGSETIRVSEKGSGR